MVLYVTTKDKQAGTDFFKCIDALKFVLNN